MDAATAEQKRRLAKLADTTMGTLYQLAGGYRTKGRVHASPELARRIEIASEKILNPAGSLMRGELSEACRLCEYAKKCEGRK